MGGYGSGRWGGHRRKITVEACRVIDISEWVRDRMILPGESNGGAYTGDGMLVDWEVDATDLNAPTAWLRCTLPGTKESVACEFGLEATELPWSGLKWWFLCPVPLADGSPCHRRARKLFLPPHRRLYGCRHCYALSYTTQQKDPWDRCLLKMRRIRERLRGSPDLWAEFPEKPKGMHFRTDWRLLEEYTSALTSVLVQTEAWSDSFWCKMERWKSHPRRDSRHVRKSREIRKDLHEVLTALRQGWDQTQRLKEEIRAVGEGLADGAKIKDDPGSRAEGPGPRAGDSPPFSSR